MDEANHNHQLPQELFTNEIFMRLPVKSLARCKSVCKLWNSIISSLSFSKSYLRLSPLSNQPCLLINTQNCFLSLDIANYEDDCSYISSDYDHCYEFEGNGKTLTAIPENDLSLHAHYPIVSVVASCNGLVCLYIGHGPLYVWNPVTLKHIPIPYPQPPGDDRDVWGLGYMSATEDYKLVRMQEFPLKKIQIFSFVDKSWKPTNLDSADYGYDFPQFDRPGLWFNDMICWVVSWLHAADYSLRSHQWNIIGFDLVCEKFAPIYDLKCLPHYDAADFPVIFVNDGCLHICFQNDEGEIWVGLFKQEEGGTHSFESLLRYKHDSFSVNGGRGMYIFEMLGVTKTGRYVIHVDQETILLLDPQDPPEGFHFLKIPRTNNVINYVQSLVSPQDL